MILPKLIFKGEACHGSGNRLRGWGRMPMRVWRGLTTVKQVFAKEYADAGGKLTPQEAQALVSSTLQ